TADAMKRADGSSSKTVSGSPTRPITTSRRVGGAVEHAVMRPTTTTRASDIAPRGFRSARCARSLGEFDRVVVETAAYRIGRGRGGIDLEEAEPTDVIDLPGWRLRAEIVPDHRVRRCGRGRLACHRIQGGSDREERYADHDRNLGEATKEARRAKPWVRCRNTPWTDREAHAAGRDHGPALAKRREGAAKRDLDGPAVPQRVRAFGARCRVRLERDPLSRAQPVGADQVRRLTR